MKRQSEAPIVGWARRHFRPVYRPFEIQESVDCKEEIVLDLGKLRPGQVHL
jgi:hypothetical protein